MAAQQNLLRYFIHYLNDRERRDINLLNILNNEANRVFPHGMEYVDDMRFHEYMQRYIDELRHNMFDRYEKPSWAVSSNESLMPHYVQMNVAPPPSAFNIPLPAFNIPPPVYNNPPYVIPPRRQSRRQKQAAPIDLTLNTGQGLLYKNTRRRPRRGKRAKARRSKKYTN